MTIQDPSGQNARRYERIDRRFIARVGIHAADGSLKWSVVTLQNLSAGGMYFIYDREVKVGSALKIKIDFPNRIIECAGNVVRLESWGKSSVNFSVVGVSFDELSREDREFMTHFVDAFESQAKNNR